MTKIKHTPGPWVATAQGNDTIYIHDINPMGKTFGTIAEIGSDSKYPEIYAIDKANAQLIAAAPDLLEALKNIENDDNSIPPAIWLLVKNAIAKAEGGAV